jgi:hypothetical protein
MTDASITDIIITIFVKTLIHSTNKVYTTHMNDGSWLLLACVVGIQSGNTVPVLKHDTKFVSKFNCLACFGRRFYLLLSMLEAVPDWKCVG